MIARILEFSLRRRALVFLSTGVLFAAGLWSAWHLPIDAVPDITGVQVQINTEVPALAAEESEKLVTQVIELELAGLPGVREMRSITKFGLSQVTLQFEDGTDIFRARQFITERLQGALEQLPPGVMPKLAPISTGLGEIFYYSLSYRDDATNRPATEREQLVALTELQTYFVKPRLRTVPGLADVNESGGYRKQFVIEPKTEALAAAGLTFNDLADLVAQNVENSGGGIISRGGEQLTIRAVSRVQTLEDIAGLPLKFNASVQPLLVADVAEVKIGTRFRTGAATLNGREAVIGAAMMLTGENSRAVAQRVKKRLAEIQEKLPEGVQIETEYDRAELVNRTIGTVEKNLVEGAALVVFVLLLMLGNWRAALIVAAAIPLSFLFALTGMLHLGISGNLMSLGAVDFGLIIDGSVVIVENIVRQLGRRQQQLGRLLTGEERRQVVLNASRQVGTPMFFGVVIITVVYFPILALTDIEGKMFHPMAMTVMLALGGSLVLALTLMPALCSVWLRGKIPHGDSLLIRWARRLYEPVLNVSLRFRWLVVVSALALFIGSLGLYSRLGAEFVPTLDEGSFAAMVQKPVGISLEESLRADLEMEKKMLRDFPELTRIFSRIGTSDIATDPMPVQASDLYFTYRPLKEWPQGPGRPRSKEELQQRVGTVLKTMNPDGDFIMTQPIEMRFNEMLEGTKAELAVKIFGEDYDQLGKLARQIRTVLEATPGVGQVEYETEGRTPQLQINVRRDVLRRHNLQAGEVNRAVSAALAGKIVGTVVEENHRHDLVVRLPEAWRADDERIKELPLRVGEHGLLALGEVVDFTVAKKVEPIQRDEGRRRAALMVELNTRDIQGFVREAGRRLRAQVEMPEGYGVEFAGQFENLQQARARLAVVVPAALGLIFILIFMALGSFRQACLVCSGIPLAVTGGVLALGLRGMPFSITAAVGFIALSGVAVLNGLVMISCFNQLRAEGKSSHEASIGGTLMRLRPILTTALVASLGFVPMAVATGAGAEVQRPLATVVIGGILSSTFLALILLPVLYAWSEKVRPPSPVRA